MGSGDPRDIFGHMPSDSGGAWIPWNPAPWRPTPTWPRRYKTCPECAKKYVCPCCGKRHDGRVDVVPAPFTVTCGEAPVNTPDMSFTTDGTCLPED